MGCDSVVCDTVREPGGVDAGFQIGDETSTLDRGPHLSGANLVL